MRSKYSRNRAGLKIWNPPPAPWNEDATANMKRPAIIVREPLVEIVPL